MSKKGDQITWDDPEYSISGAVPVNSFYKLLVKLKITKNNWYNPLNQRLLKRGNLRTWFGGKWAILVGLSLALVVYLLSEYTNFTLIIKIFLITSVSLQLLRMLIFAWRESAEINHRIINDLWNIEFSTPLTSQEFIVALRISIFSRILNVVYETILFVTGILIILFVSDGMFGISLIYILIVIGGFSTLSTFTGGTYFRYRFNNSITFLYFLGLIGTFLYIALHFMIINDLITGEVVFTASDFVVLMIWESWFTCMLILQGWWQPKVNFPSCRRTGKYGRKSLDSSKLERLVERGKPIK